MINYNKKTQKDKKQLNFKPKNINIQLSWSVDIDVIIIVYY